MNSIRCSACGSIDPYLYSDRRICCEYILSPDTRISPGTSQYQFSSLTGNIGLFCVRGCCDLSNKYARDQCIR